MADEEQHDEGFVERIKESPRTVSAIIIILIVAAAIYAFSGDQQQPGVQPGVGGSMVEETPTRAAESPSMAEGTMMDGEQAQGEPEGQTAGEQDALPPVERNGQGYVEVAQAGDGITHLARRATSRWLSENQAGYTVTDEHRIYVEDYIQDRLGEQGLEVGEQMTVSFDLINEAVSSAQQLSDGHLDNLTPYTSALQ